MLKKNNMRLAFLAIFPYKNYRKNNNKTFFFCFKAN